MENSEIIQNDKQAFIVKVNTKGFEASIYSGKPKPSSKTYLAFNVNYSWLGLPIGLVINKGEVMKSIPLVKASQQGRPLLGVEFGGIPFISYSGAATTLFMDYALQAGPTLHDYPSSLAVNDFKTDVARVTKHVACGVTKAGKLIVGFFHNSSLMEVSAKLKELGCFKAMNCDGGSKAHLVYSASEESYSFGIKKAAAGFRFEARQ